ncbi:hypothetical protein AX16_000571 [Volvariella volvacea WC 439]|nr:hypothetical protein AX16_000571 [Volvariella volvacea WC 439]
MNFTVTRLGTVGYRQSRAVVPVLSRQARMRMLHSTPVACKTVGEKVSEVADKVNRKVGKGLASAIDKGEQATYATKEKLEHLTSQTEEKADQAKESVEEQAKKTADKAQRIKKDAEDRLH